MPESHCYVFGWNNSQILIIVEGNLDLTITTKSRGRARNCGSGPYFVATKVASEVTYGNNLKFVPGITLSNNGNTVSEKTFGSSCYAAVTRVDGYGLRHVQQAYGTRIDEFGPTGNGHEIILKYSIAYKGWGYINDPITGDSPGDWQATAAFQLGLLTWSQTTVRLRNVDGTYPNSVPKLKGYVLPKFNFQNGEWTTFWWSCEFGILVNGSGSRFSAAYVNAMENLETTTVNSLGNIIEIAGSIYTAVKTLRNVFRGNWGQVARDLREAVDPRNLWLSYRYQYLTTKSDIEDYKKMLQRLGDLATLGEYIHSSGSFADSTGSYKVELVIRTDEIIPKDTMEFLAAVGVEPNAQNLWDLIPYSFIVDWFFHIDKLAGLVDRWGDAIQLPIAKCWFTYMSEYDGQHVFFRLHGRRPDIPPAYVSKEASGKTIGMRVADTLSLLR